MTAFAQIGHMMSYRNIDVLFQNPSFTIHKTGKLEDFSGTLAIVMKDSGYDLEYEDSRDITPSLEAISWDGKIQ